MSALAHCTPAAPPAASAGPLAGESLPAIPAYACAECGAQTPGGGVHRQSLAMIPSACGPIRRGGRCRTCKRVAARAALAFDAAGVAYLAEHGRGISGPARRPIQDAAIQAGHAARLAVLTAEVERAARRVAREVPA